MITVEDLRLIVGYVVTGGFAILFAIIGWLLRQALADIREMKREMADYKTKVAEEYVKKSTLDTVQRDFSAAVVGLKSELSTAVVGLKTDLERELGRIDKSLERIFDLMQQKVDKA